MTTLETTFAVYLAGAALTAAYLIRHEIRCRTLRRYWQYVALAAALWPLFWLAVAVAWITED